MYIRNLQISGVSPGPFALSSETDWTVIVVFRGRNGKFAAAKFAPFRNLLQISLLFMKNLSFYHFKTEVFFFLSDNVPKVSIVPFF